MQMLMAPEGLTGKDFPEALALLQRELQAALQRLRSSAAKAERQRSEARLAAERRDAAHHAARRQADASAQLANLEDRRHSLTLDLQRRRAEVQHRVEQQADKRGRLEVQISEVKRELERIQHLVSEEEQEAARNEASEVLETDVQAAADAASEPLRRQLRELLAELSHLERRFSTEVLEQKRTWAAHTEARATEESSRMSTRQAQLVHEISEARTQLAVAKRSETGAFARAEAHNSELCEQLAKSQAELEEVRSVRRQCQGECDAARQDEMRLSRSLEQATERLEQAQHARTQGLEEFQLRQQELRRRQRQELEALRGGREQEIARARALMQHSLSSLSSVAVEFEGGMDDDLVVVGF